jgi:hypothetical protein
MPKKKGDPKTGGRSVGAKNKKTEQWEVFAAYCMDGGLAKLEEELHKLKGKDFINAFSLLLEYHKPKLARTEVSGGDKAIEHVITFKD